MIVKQEMLSDKHDLADYAKILRVHPRTILRRVSGQENPYWGPTLKADLTVEEVANSFDMHPKILWRCMHDRDQLITTEEGAAMWGITTRAFRYRGYKKAICSGTVTRYSKKHVISKSLHTRYIKED